MAKINTTNYQPVTSWNGTQDLFIVEQPGGTKVATPEQVKQYVEAGDFVATGEVIDGHGNVLADMAKSADVDEQFADLNDDLTLEKFTVTLASAIGTPNQFDSNCFYNPKTKQVHLDIMIYSSDSLIPSSGNVVFTVPAKYRPAVNTQLGLAMVTNNYTQPKAERCWMGTDGAFRLNNFIYNSQPVQLFALKADYISV